MLQLAACLHLSYHLVQYRPIKRPTFSCSPSSLLVHSNFSFRGFARSFTSIVSASFVKIVGESSSGRCWVAVSSVDGKRRLDLGHGQPLFWRASSPKEGHVVGPRFWERLTWSRLEVLWKGARGTGGVELSYSIASTMLLYYRYYISWPHGLT